MRRAPCPSCSRPRWRASGALAVGLFLAAVGDARAARVTEVADAADGDDPFDAHFELRFDVVRHSGVLSRENYQPPPSEPNGAARLVDVREMSFDRVRFRARPRLELGLFRDLAIFAEWPVVLWDQTRFRYAEGTSETNSTLGRDQAPNDSPGVDSWDADGKPITEGAGNADPQNQDGKYGFPGKAYNDWRFDHQKGGSFVGYRQGFDNPTFGLRFSPTSNERNPSAPTTTVQLDYTAPLLSVMDPTNDQLSDADQPGPVGDGAHRFHASVAMSKRYAPLDPYFVIEYALPLPASGSALLGFFPRQSAACTLGVELQPFSDGGKEQVVLFDLAVEARYFSEGRDYSIASDVLREQTFVDQSLRMGLQGGVEFRWFDLFFLDLNGLVAHDTPHLLTKEIFGLDGNDEGSDVNLESAAERNPYFNPALDAVGRRVRIEQSLYLGAIVQLGATF